MQTKPLWLFILLFMIVPASIKGQSFPAKFQNLPKPELLDTLLSLSEFHSYDQPDSAVIYANQAMLLLEDQGTEDAAYAYKLLADAYYYQNEFRSAIEAYQKSGNIEILLGGNSSVKYAQRINDVGYCYYVMGIYDLAIENYIKALKILENSEEPDEYYTILNNMGSVYFNQGNYQKAIECFEQTLEYDESTGNLNEASITYNNIGKVYQAWGKYDAAIEHIRKALDHSKNSGNLKTQAIRLSNLGMVYLDMGDPEKALSLLEEALKLDQASGNEFKIAIRKSEIARIFAESGDFAQAINFSNEALKFFSTANILESMAIVNNDLGGFYMGLRNYPKAEESFLKCIHISSGTGSNYMIMNAYEGLSSLYQEWDKADLALEYYKKADTIHQELFNTEKHRQLANFEIKYQTKEKEIENEVLKRENESKQSRLILLTIGIISLLFIMFLLVWSIRLKNKNLKQQKVLAEHVRSEQLREKQHYEDKIFAEKQINRLQTEQYQQNIEHKNQLLANSTLGLIQKNDFLINLKTKIAESGEENGISKKEIISLINQNIDIDQDWNKFQLEFSGIHPGFFDRLKNDFPDLSEPFVQLCAFLRIDLTSNEIAQLQNISISAVYKNRQRLRKKLGLEAEADLSGFLKNLV